MLYLLHVPENTGRSPLHTFIQLMANGFYSQKAPMKGLFCPLPIYLASFHSYLI